MTQRLTKHAEMRCRQRGVKSSIVGIVLKYSDFEMPTYASCTRLQISREAAESMLSEGIQVSAVDEARKIALIVDGNDRVVTVIKVASYDRRIRVRRNELRDR